MAGVPAAGKMDPASPANEANRRCFELLISYCGEQKLISHRLNVDELW